MVGIVLAVLLSLSACVQGLTPTPTPQPASLQVVPGIIKLTPEKAENPVGTDHKLMATVLDPSGKPMAGVKVGFAVTGANPTTGTAVTDGAGQAFFSYRGNQPGDDAITAMTDKLSATAYKYWSPAK